MFPRIKKMFPHVGRYSYNKKDLNTLKNFFNEKLPSDIIDNIITYLAPKENNHDDYWTWAEYNQNERNKIRVKEIKEIKEKIKNNKAKKWTIKFGKYKGRTYENLFYFEKNYSNWLIEKQIIKEEAIISLYCLIKDDIDISRERTTVNYD